MGVPHRLAKVFPPVRDPDDVVKGLRLNSWTMALMILALVAAPIVVADAERSSDIQLSARGTSAEFKGCNEGACTWRFSGTANGLPFEEPVATVTTLETASPFADSCQPAMGETKFWWIGHNGRLHPIGWKTVSSGDYCPTSGGHYFTGTFTVEPDGPPGRYGRVVGNGVAQHTDSAPDTVGAGGAWEANANGRMQW